MRRSDVKGLESMLHRTTMPDVTGCQTGLGTWCDCSQPDAEYLAQPVILKISCVDLPQTSRLQHYRV